MRTDGRLLRASCSVLFGLVAVLLWFQAESLPHSPRLAARCVAGIACVAPLLLHSLTREPRKSEFGDHPDAGRIEVRRASGRAGGELQFFRSIRSPVVGGVPDEWTPARRLEVP
jgi:hypothetical protein